MMPNSAGSQFFIMHRRAPHLDGEYAAFGKLIEGFDVLDEIASCPTDFADKPKKPVVMEEVTAETVKLAGSDWELISLYYGSDLTQSEADKIAAELEALDGGWEVTVFDGGQPLYPLLLSLE